jgi:hypothetical protein
MEKKRVSGRFVRNEVEEASGPAKKPAAVGAPRPGNCRVYARKRMAESMQEIVQALTEKAKGGSVPHTKMLAELSGLTRGEVAPKVVKRRGKSLAGLLLEELGDDE